MRKILIVGSGIIDKPHAAGITVRSIIDGVRPELVKGLVWGEKAVHISSTKIQQIKLSYKFYSPAWILDSKRLKKASHSIKKVEIRTQSTQSKGNKLEIIKKTIRWLRQWLALIPARSRVNITRQEIDEIKAFTPEVIYTVGESVATLRLAYQLSLLLNIPIVIHFMDNWRNSIEWATNPLLRGYQKKLRKYCDLCYSRTTECIAISDRMAEEYEKETGVKHSIIMNSIDTQRFYCHPRKSDGTIRCVYAGGLHLGRDKALRIIAECIEHICEKKSAEFLIYTSVENIDLYSKQFECLKHTHFYPAISHDQICSLYENSDILIHVENNALQSNEFFRYSVSTKISEYLATGRSFLFYGPENIYLFDFLRTNQLSYTASNEEEIEKALWELVDGGYEYNKYSENARKYAQNHYDVSVARSKFQEIIERVRVPK